MAQQITIVFTLLLSFVCCPAMLSEYKEAEALAKAHRYSTTPKSSPSKIVHIKPEEKTTESWCWAFLDCMCGHLKFSGNHLPPQMRG
jgi:hypothetical protein